MLDLQSLEPVIHACERDEYMNLISAPKSFYFYHIKKPDMEVAGRYVNAEELLLKLPLRSILHADVGGLLCPARECVFAGPGHQGRLIRRTPKPVLHHPLLHQDYPVGSVLRRVCESETHDDCTRDRLPIFSSLLGVWVRRVRRYLKADEYQEENRPARKVAALEHTLALPNRPISAYQCKNTASHRSEPVVDPGAEGGIHRARLPLAAAPARP
mmetsp:Transcript_914/g.2064  ORF Transcript_914/g.2064 Transcript_914/m.2064 type:complete len:214 (+) Transcript_914:552-1193(+)